MASSRLLSSICAVAQPELAIEALFVALEELKRAQAGAEATDLVNRCADTRSRR